MSETASRLLQLLSLLQARRDWAGEELADRLERLREDGPARRRPTARAGLSGRVGDRAGGRLPAARRKRAAAAAARRRGGDRDRGRAQHRGARVGDRDRGDRGARAREARAGASRAPAQARARPRRRHVDAAAGRPHGGPPAPHRDRRRVPRSGVPSIRLPPPRRNRPAAGWWSPTPSSTTGAAGTSSRGTASPGLADLPLGSSRQGDVLGRAVLAPRGCRRRTRRPTSSRASRARPTGSTRW